MIKQLFGYLMAWSLYWLGDLISRPMQHWNWYWYWAFPIYHRLMCWSILIQDWSNNDSPWANIKQS